MRGAGGALYRVTAVTRYDMCCTAAVDLYNWYTKHKPLSEGDPREACARSRQTTGERNTPIFLRGEAASKLSAMLLFLTELRACRRQGSLAIVHAVREVSQLAVQSLE